MLLSFSAQSLSIATWTIESINQQMQSNTQLLLGLHELSDLINRISTQNSLMRTFSENYGDLENSTLFNFAEWTVSPSSLAIQGLLDRTHLLMTGTQDLSTVGSKGVLYMIADNLQVTIVFLNEIFIIIFRLIISRVSVPKNSSGVLRECLGIPWEFRDRYIQEFLKRLPLGLFAFQKLTDGKEEGC